MNNNNLNLNSINGDDLRQNLPLKAYFLNKYEHSTNNGDRSLLDNISSDSVEPGQAIRVSREQLYQELSVSRTPQQQKNTYTANESTLSMYTAKTSMPNLHNDFSSDSINKMNLASKLHFSGSQSSLINSDDEDDYQETTNGSIHEADRSREEKRRISHTAAEQKRRNAIKQGYELIRSVVPSCQQTDPLVSTRITRAITLEETIDYIHEMEKEKDNHEQELDSLKKEIIALKIMKSNYEEMLKFHKNQPKDNRVEINDETVFDLFVKFSDNLFQTFQSVVNANSFAEMTCSTLNWLEQMCTTKNLKNLVLLSIYQTMK